KTNGQLTKTPATVANAQPLKYGDGSAIDVANLTEALTFQQYEAEKKATPESKAVLLEYYQQRVQVLASAAS
ncbi:MAG: hypothetical protein GY803_33020, partial [Chloroflexi bacterium]|nr:hypothetical protein [Chloroflexota bacterium]